MFRPASTPASQLGPPPAAPADQPLLGMGLVTLGLVFFACSDAISKYLTADLPAIEIAWLRWLGFTTMILPVLAWTRSSILVSRVPASQCVRAIGLLFSSVFFIKASEYVPMATATSIAFVSPLTVALLSMPLLGERIRRSHWIAIAAGLAGVLIIVRPGADMLRPGAVFPILSALSWSFGVIFTRRIGRRDRPLTGMAYLALVGFAVLSVLVIDVWVAPSGHQLALAAAMSFAAGLGQICLQFAYMRAPASLLAPMSYTQIVSSTALGYFVFGDLPGLWTIAGAGIVVASGLYVARSGRQPRPRRLDGPDQITANSDAA